ncbi:MAG: hypothetical protein V5A29_03065 [Haloarculaceae archaeon]
MTDNHSYETPSKGEANWHVPLNSNFENLDTDVEIRDLEENRGSYAPKQGAKFLATDTESAFVGDGEDWVRLGSRGKQSSFESVSTDRLFSGTDDRAGALLVDENGGYRAVSFLTDEVWTDSSDAGVVLQKLADALSDANGGERLGQIKVGQGTFGFSTTVELGTDDRDHRGMAFEGQSFKQSNQWSQTVFKNNGISEGRGIIEFGGPDRSGHAAGGHIKGIYFDGSDANIHPIYNYGQDRIRLTDVKVEHVGPKSHGILYIDSYNSTWMSVYGHQCAVLTDTAGADKGTNSFRAIDCTFNTETPDVPTFTVYGDGMSFIKGAFNAKDVVDGQTSGVPVFSGRTEDIVAVDSDSRLQGSGHNLEATFKQCGFLETFFSGGNSQTVLLHGPSETNFNQCEFNNSDTVFAGMGSTVRISNCKFSAGGTGVGLCIDTSGNDHNLNRVSVMGCLFQDYTDHALRFGDRKYFGFQVMGNVFHSSNASHDIYFEDGKADGPQIVGNYLENGINQQYFSARPIRSAPPMAIHNAGYNPVGFSGYDAPSVPSAGSEWQNNRLQPATVYLSGDHEGTVLYDMDGEPQNSKSDSDGKAYVSSVVLDECNQITVEPQEGISFSTPPSDWGVYWH